MVFSHVYDEVFDLLHHTGSIEVAAVLASVELLRDQAVVLAQECLGGGNRDNLLQACTAFWIYRSITWRTPRSI